MAEIIVTIVIEVAKFLGTLTEPEIRYLREYKSNFGNLKEEVNKLRIKNTIIQHSVDEAKRKGDEIEEFVQKWLERTSKIIDEEAAQVIEDREETAAKKRCFMGLCPDLKSRRQLSKEAVQQRDKISGLLEAGNFDRISYSIIPKDPRLSNKDYETFESRLSTLTHILWALSNVDVNMIGIYGMGGVGKTTLAKEVARQAEGFDRVIFAKVSQTPNIRNIQQEIADQLGLPLSDEKSEPGRATQLWDQLKKENKVLVILDDIWASLNLVDLGIPLGDGDKGCKLLLTARTQHVLLSAMGSKQNFLVGVINDEEAWRLLKKTAGDYVEGVQFKSAAMEVAKECAGLPISIVMVGRALRSKELDEWEDALVQLKRSSLRNYATVYLSTIELSYNYLESDELKGIFLLIAYSYITLVDDLLMYGVGLGLLQGINNMKEAQARVRTFVNKLRASCMLLDDKNNVEDFIMHDVVRDVAISIASREQHVLTTRNQQVNQEEISRWLMSPDENTTKSCNSMVLIDAEIPELPQLLEYPQLKLFSIRARDSSLRISDNFFKTTTELRVLDLTYMDLLSPPSSLGLLTNLQTLCLYGCELQNIAVIGGLKKLEILFIQRSDIERLPVELGQLTQLKSLELRECFRLEVIPPNVLSRLSNLEELSTGNFAEWEIEEPNKERRNASLDELKNLSNQLTALQICIKDAKTLPKDLFFKKLERYQILIIRDPWFFEHTSMRTPREISRQFKLELTNTNICLHDGHIMQLKGIQDLHLQELQDMKNVVFELDREGFPQLKYLEVQSNPDLLYIVDSTEHVTRTAFPLLESLSLVDLTNMEKICRGQLTAESFSQLRKVNVRHCEKLKDIFSFSIARGFQQLESIDLFNCRDVEKIIAVEKEDESNNNCEVIELSQLRSVTLYHLPQLTSFCSRSERRQDGTLFNEKVALPKLEVLELYETKVERIWQSQVSPRSYCVQNLTRLIVRGCSNLRCLFTSSIASNLVRLQHLEICECSALKEIVVVDETHDLVFPYLKFLKMESLESLTNFFSGDYIAFPSLKELEIIKCPKLMEFMAKNITSTNFIKIALFNEKVAFPSLEQLSVEHCDKLQTILPCNVCRKFFLLESLSVSCCGSLEVIFDLEEPNFEDKYTAVVTQLSYLHIDGLPKLKHVWNKDPQKFLSFQELKRVTIHNCDGLKNVFPVSISSQLSQLESLDISGCGVEEIVFDSEEGSESNPRFVFPSVNSLTLHDLPKYKTFFPGIHTTEWPALKKLVVSRWEIVKIFTSERISFQESNKEGQHDITALQPQFMVGKVFPNLQELVVRGMGIAKMIWQFPEELPCKLKFLSVEFDESTVIFSLDFIQRFQGIKMLTIEGFRNASIEEAGNGISAWISYLNRCRDLKHILKDESNMDHLVHLDIAACHNLVNLVPSLTSFQNLTTLEVTFCHGLKKIVTSSTAKSLVRLRVMKFFECNMISEVVAADDEDERDAAKADNDHEIVFRELKELRLVCLKNLTSFCSGNYNFSFPSLKELNVIHCPKMNMFSAGGELRTPKLQKVKRDWSDKSGCWKTDLNTTIRQLHEVMEEDEEEPMWEEDEEEPTWEEGEEESDTSTDD